ncbi:MAG: hypothetical protein HFJ53_06410 [Clostridia bacterium]|jgi:hypothetical protein|nr:hypothetical protein [Clostridia bacterium]
MENASKALIITGGVLLGVLLLILMVFMFRSMGGFSKAVNENIEKKTVAEFNAPFEKYDKNANLTAQDVVTISNLVRSNNKKMQTEGTQNAIVMNLTGVGSYSNMANKYLMDTQEENYRKITNEFIKQYSVDKKSTFKCTGVKYDKKTALVNRIDIQLNI